jgi:hypothetical protein
MSKTAAKLSSESRTTFPFKRAEFAEGSIKFRPDAQSTFRDLDEWIAEEREFGVGEFVEATFAPEFAIDIDPKSIADAVGLEPDDLVLAIVLEDPAAWACDTVARWPLSSAPKRYKLTPKTLSAVAGNKGVSLTVQLTPSERVATTTFEAGDRIAAIRFDLRCPSEGSEFPTSTVPDTHFEGLNLPASTFWMIDWRSEDFDVPVEDALVVLISETAYGRIAGAQTGMGKIFWADFGCQILTEIAFRYLEAGAPTTPAKTLGFMVANALRQGSGKDLVQLAKEVGQRGGLSRTRAYVHAAMTIREEIANYRTRGGAQ